MNLVERLFVLAIFILFRHFDRNCNLSFYRAYRLRFFVHDIHKSFFLSFRKAKKGLCCRLLAHAFSTHAATHRILFEPSQK